MEQLIKITSEPIRMIRFSQNARLVSSDNIDMERRKALARQMSMRNSAGQSGVSVEDIKRINHTFSKKQVSSQVSGEGGKQQVVARPQMQAARTQAHPQMQIPVSTPSPESLNSGSVPASDAVSAPVSQSAAAPVQNISVQSSSSYAAQRGAFEMRVAKGELTYLPPMMMTIVTQRPSVHVEYLGDFNYVPPRDDSGSNVNLAT
ncbi:MAG: hypothetical protein HFG76_09505 [Hungatella sp.]|jgi:hypothetical protein|nr:hypothetical protein [Hungatella sp.]MCI9636421.1 hypothetical protein [Hungatella sp.]